MLDITDSDARGTYRLVTKDGNRILEFLPGEALAAYLDYTKAAQWRRETLCGSDRPFFVAANGDILYRTYPSNVLAAWSDTSTTDGAPEPSHQYGITHNGQLILSGYATEEEAYEETRQMKEADYSLIGSDLAVVRVDDKS